MALLLTFILLLAPCRVEPAAFASGNVLALRVSAATLTTSSAAVFIDELTSAGSLVQTISVPSTGGSACTLPGISSGAVSGKLTTSTTGSLASLACYASAAGTANVASSGGNRAVQMINSDGTVGAFSSLGQFNSPARETYAALANTAGAADFYNSGVGGGVRGLGYAATGVILTTTDTAKVSGLRSACLRAIRRCIPAAAVDRYICIDALRGRPVVHKSGGGWSP
jgi:hypothetical protein